MKVIERLKELQAKLTPGKWTKGKGAYLIRREESEGNLNYSWDLFVARTRIPRDAIRDNDEVTATFIVESRNALPALLAVAEAAKALRSTSGDMYTQADLNIKLDEALKMLE